MDTELRQTILEANLDLHREEAELYDRIHPELNNTEERSRLERLLDAVVEDLPANVQKSALDVGAGTGLVTGELLKRGFEVQAVDISREMLGMLESKFSAVVKSGRITTAAKDIDSFLKETQKKFTLITISSVLHHLPDYEETLRALARRVEPGGALVIFHEPKGGDLSGLEKILLSLDWKFSWRFQTSNHDRDIIKSKKLDYGMADYHVTHGFDEEKVRGALKEGGLKIEIVEMYATAKTWPIRMLLSLFGMKRTWCLVTRKA